MLLSDERRARGFIVPIRNNSCRHKRNHNRICVLIIGQERVLSHLGVWPESLSVGDITQNLAMGNDNDFALLFVA